MPANEQLLQRDIARANAEQDIGDVLVAIREMVEEGTQLLARLLTVAGTRSPPRRYHAALLLLLWHIHELLDAIDELLLEGITAPAALQVRGIVEAHAQMLYLSCSRVEFGASPLGADGVDPIPKGAAGTPLTGQALENEREFRGAAHVVAYLRNQVSQWERLTTRNVQAWLQRITGRTGVPATVTDPATQSGLQSEISRLKVELASADNAAVDAEFMGACGKKKHDPASYALRGGPSSVFGLAASVGLAAEYDLFYSPASAVMHGQDAGGQLGPKRDTGGRGPARLRDGRLGYDVIPKTVLQTIQIYRHVILAIRPGDEPMWKKWVPRWTAVLREP